MSGATVECTKRKAGICPVKVIFIPITVKWSSYAQSRTDKPVKGMLTGPVTILNWSFPREDISIKDSTLQIALAIKDEVLDLEAAGVKIIQIDEACSSSKIATPS